MNLTHTIYPSFITRMNTTYFSLDIQNTNMNDDLLSIYNDVSNPNHGGKYKIIYNVPIHTSTNNPLTQEAKEIGISINDSLRDRKSVV